MPSNVIMPQMGESIFEGTITRWLKNVGDRVERDEPLFEISTDKVDSEIPASASGILREILFQEGETVEINTVVAIIDDDPGAVQDSAGDGNAVLPQESEQTPGPDPRPEAADSRRGIRASPLVRRMAQEEGIDLREIEGTGLGGRITKRDILNYLSERERIAEVTRPLVQQAQEGLGTAPADQDEIVPMTAMRRSIAEHMISSRRTSAHVTSVFEVDMTAVVRIKEENAEKFALREGFKLSLTPFFVKGVVDTLKDFPILNASMVGNDIVYKKDINLGVAVALDWGLIVPVIRQAQQKTLVGLAREVADLSHRARQKQLSPEEVQGGTFTLTNPGVFGSLIGTPIINQPQVAILCVGAVTKRAVVINDAIAIRSMAYLSLTFDHRLIDGAVGDGFLASLRGRLEGWSYTID
ncbi:MAG: dihydrolipoamide acetyltransferase family protein [Acidobacteriota bacterium]|nr:dihydrolipoamide acetyltransferase family protein [Acidobacteriota bacterium]